MLVSFPDSHIDSRVLFRGKGSIHPSPIIKNVEIETLRLHCEYHTDGLGMGLI